MVKKVLLRNMLGQDISAEDVMIPRADIVSVDIQMGLNLLSAKLVRQLIAACLPIKAIWMSC